MAAREREAVHARQGGRQRTKQADTLDTDVNVIVGRFIAHGQLPNDGQTPNYGDFTNVDGYHAALNLVKAARDDFDALPASVRKHVDNDPGKFLDLVYDPDRRGELEELGLIDAQAPEAAPPAKTETENPTPPDPPAPPE